MKHTPEPWRLIAQGEANQWCILGPDDQWVIGLIHNGSMLVEKQHATMERIVACVNFCKGKSTELLQAVADYDAADASAAWESPHPIFRLAEENDRLRAENERLQKIERRFTAMLPLFEEARDALPAISETARSLHGLSPSLAARMDDVGVPDRWLQREAERADKERQS